jgi:hypothetical protein
MKIKRIGSQASQRGPAEFFTGIVRIDPLFQGSEPSRVRHGIPTPLARPWPLRPVAESFNVRENRHR